MDLTTNGETDRIFGEKSGEIVSEITIKPLVDLGEKSFSQSDNNENNDGEYERAERISTTCDPVFQDKSSESNIDTSVLKICNNCNSCSCVFRNEREETFKFSETPNLEDIRKVQKKFVEERGWSKYHSPRNLLIALVGEVGELSEEFQWRSDSECTPGLSEWTQNEKHRVADEMSDILVYLIRLAEVCRIDLPAHALHKIAENKRKYPANEVFGSSKKYTEY